MSKSLSFQSNLSENLSQMTLSDPIIDELIEQRCVDLYLQRGRFGKNLAEFTKDGKIRKRKASMSRLISQDSISKRSKTDKPWETIFFYN